MAKATDKSIALVAQKVNDYPERAYHFIREGLTFAVHAVHGPESAAQIAIMRHLASEQIELSDFVELYETGQLKPSLMRAVEEAGGIERINRHVSGAQLCWGLRDYALMRWGRVARCVLNSWNIRRTGDFGRMVFALIEHEFLQRQPGDKLEDFVDVFDFPVALDRSYQVPSDIIDPDDA
jgi:uncharacterized repeat protein (TIGR04138 family)